MPKEERGQIMKGFVFDETTHTGTFNGVEVPSVTQLVSILFPMGNINEETLKKASDRGTLIHEDIDNFACGFTDECRTQEGNNFIALLTCLDFEVLDSEFEVYFMQGENIVAYGHVDQLLKANSYIYLDEDNTLHIEKEPTFVGGEQVLIKRGAIILNDNKTVAQFDNRKVELQENLYSVCCDSHYQQLNIDNIVGIWVRENKVQLRVLDKRDDKTNRATMLNLVERWKELNEQR